MRLTSIFVLACALALFAVPAMAMALDIGGTVQGRTAGVADAPLQNVEVTLYDANGDYYDYAYTNLFGNYTFANVDPGSYRIEFMKGGYVTQYYNNKPTLLQSDLVPAGTTGIGTILLSDQAKINGKVLGKNAGVADAAVQNVEVTAYDAATGLEIGYDYTDAVGNYTISCDAIPVKIGFKQGNYVDQYYNNKASLDAAQVVNLSPAQNLTNVNATIVSKYGKVKGTVVGKVAGVATNAPVNNVEVNVYDAATGQEIGYDYTDAYGNYEVVNVPFRNIKIGFKNGSFIDQYWNNKPTLAGATVVALAPAQLLSNVSPTLVSKYAKVKGNVKGLPSFGANPGNLSNIEVELIDATTLTMVGYDYTDQAGNYEIQVPNGAYKLRFNDGQTSGYARQFYNNKSTPGTAQTLNLAPAQLMENVNATLYRPGVIYFIEGKSSGPIAYDLLSFLKTTFSFKCDQPGVAAKLVLKTASGDKTIFDVANCGNTAYTYWSFPQWDGKVAGQRLASASYTWELTLTKNGNVAKTTGKILISKVMFTLSGTSANNVPVTKQAYMVPGNANVYVNASTTAASDTFTSKLSGPNAYNVNVGSWTLNSSAAIKPTAYVNGANAVKSKALHTWSMTGLKNVKYSVTVIQ